MDGNIALVLEDVPSEELSSKVMSYAEIVNYLEHYIQEELDKNNSSDAFLASELDYTLNYTVKELIRIAEYYELFTKRKKKSELIESIVVYESNNEAAALRRRVFWSLIKILQKDKYLNRFIMFD